MCCHVEIFHFYCKLGFLIHPIHYDMLGRGGFGA